MQYNFETLDPSSTVVHLEHVTNDSTILIKIYISTIAVESVNEQYCFEGLAKDALISQNYQFNPISADPRKRSNTLKQLVGNSQQII